MPTKARQRLTGSEDPLQDRNLEDFLLSNDMAGMIEQIRVNLMTICETQRLR
ncbi:MAG: hypothetical protein R3C26_03525 [Calditrichia bacterium]